jgi:hypothetical protein
MECMENNINRQERTLSMNWKNDNRIRMIRWRSTHEIAVFKFGSVKRRLAEPYQDPWKWGVDGFKKITMGQPVFSTTPDGKPTERTAQKLEKT